MDRYHIHRPETGPLAAFRLGALGMLDCKATSPDGREQCMCRATWPKEDA